MFVPDIVSTVVALPVMFQVPAAYVNVRVPEPVAEKMPTENVLPFMSKVPAVNVNVRVVPSVRLSASWNVPPAPLIVMGKSSVPAALVVSVLVPDVAANVVALDPPE